MADKNLTTKKRCTNCIPHIQDEWYGDKIRVHNLGRAKKGAQTRELLCTVCGEGNGN